MSKTQAPGKLSCSCEQYIQVGVTALRDPATGDFLPAVPLYIRTTPETKAAEEALTQDIAGVLAERFQSYLEQTRKHNKGGQP